MKTDWRKRIVDRAPIPLLTHAHETFLAVAMCVIGFGLIFGGIAPDSVHRSVPAFIATGWAWSIFGGAALTLWGLFYDRPRTEWAGQILLGWGTGFYAVALLAASTPSSSGVAVAVFGGFAGVSWWRAFKISSAGLIQLRLARAARDAHKRVARDRGVE